MKYKILEYNNMYYLYTKVWWFPIWISEHSGLNLASVPPFCKLSSVEDYIKRKYINKPTIVKEGTL